MLVAVAAGILLSYYDLLPVLPTLLVSACLFVVLLGFGVFFPLYREVIWGSAALLFFFGFSLWNTTHALQRSDWDERSSGPSVYSVQVLDSPVERAKSYQLQVGFADHKKAVLYLQKDSALRLPVPGDRLLVRTTISRPQPADEYSFDYGHYLQLQGFVGSGVVNKGGMLYVGHEDLRGLMPMMHRLRDRIEHAFDGFALRERSVLESLLLGDRRHLNADTRAAFAASGAMHILAVSGLHVGIIVGILMWVLTLGKWRKPTYTNDNKHYWRALILCSILIFYALLTGLSPSVCRSVLMFILLAVGSLVRPIRSRYNDIAASAFLILLVSPLALFHSGFLLSYSAVLAIVRFYPSFRIKSKKRFLRRLYSLVAISLCAQLGTLPWTIYFFHRVSNYFVLTNLGVLPLVEYLLIPTFFVFIVLAPIPFVGPIVGKVLERETWLLNEYVEWIQALPGSSAELYLNAWLTALLIGIVVCFMLKTRYRWWAAGALTLVFIGSFYLDYRRSSEETDLRLYQRGRSVAVMAREGHAAVLLTNDKGYTETSIHDYQLARHVNQTTYLPLDTTQQFVAFQWQGEEYYLQRSASGYYSKRLVHRQ